MFIKKELSILATSDPAQGAINLSADGSEFEIQLEQPIEIPREAENVQLVAESSTVWWTVPNIIEPTNNKFYIFGDLAIGGTQNFVITIPQGLYDLGGLNTALLRGLETAGAKTSPEPLLSFSADSSTQKVVLRLNYPNTTIDFSQPETPYEILGFDQQIYGPEAGAPVSILAPEVASFNQVNYFLIACDLVQQGIRFNNRYNQIITQVLIDVAPGSQIVSRETNPPRINCEDLAGAKRTNIRFRLTDDKLRPVNTNGEFFTTRIVLRYLIPVKIA